MKTDLFDIFGDVREFHEKFGIGYDGPPRALPQDLEVFRTTFVAEEHREFQEAETDEKRLDAICDEIYVLVGYAYLRGWDFREAFRRVHQANMAKVLSSSDCPSVREVTHSADVVKPPGWTPPDLSDLVAMPVTERTTGVDLASGPDETVIASAGCGDRELGAS